MHCFHYITLRKLCDILFYRHISFKYRHQHINSLLGKRPRQVFEVTSSASPIVQDNILWFRKILHFYFPQITTLPRAIIHCIEQSRRRRRGRKLQRILLRAWEFECYICETKKPVQSTDSNKWTIFYAYASRHPRRLNIQVWHILTVSGGLCTCIIYYI